jgi:hypothetical protein
MIGAQKARTFGMRIFAAAFRKDTERGKQPQHTVECIAVDTRRFGKSFCAFRGFSQCIGNTKIGDCLKATRSRVRVGDLHDGCDGIGLHGNPPLSVADVDEMQDATR